MAAPTPGESFVEEAVEEAGDNLPVPVDAPGDASAEDAAEDAAEEATGEKSISGALTHTKPDLSPQAYEAEHEVSKSASHAYVGVRKVVAYFAEMGDKAADGTMAVENFLWATYHGFVGRDDDADQEDAGDDDTNDASEFSGENYHDPAGDL